ncbi:hypothetical protein ASJ81_18280 [Methanosarcina spelaei]|uniref:Uncharacterized protein n=1 Tax=Methanosarcina spelaei TaxID=1036679 RepID=A0A2A2HVL5_9EURY|nr:hypothetical protein ASJ81_18280 [Methanosarcina spelaei]
MACNNYSSFLHRQESSKNIDYSTLPSSIGSEKRENFSISYLKTDIIDCFYFVEKILKVIYFYNIVFQNQYPILLH